MFDLALLRELQNRPWKTNFIVFFTFIISEHLVKFIFLMAQSMTYDIYIFFLTFLYKIFDFTLNKLIWEFSLNFKNYPCHMSLFTNSAPLGPIGHRVALSVCLCVCFRHEVQFFLGLSLALRSHDQIPASDLLRVNCFARTEFCLI